MLGYPAGMARLVFQFLLSAACLLPTLAAAWGPHGHRIIGDLAGTELKPQARAEVARLLAGEPEPGLAGIANWADTLRESAPALAKRTGRWHFVNFPRGDCHYAPPRDCPNGDCVVAAINRNFLVLSDRKRGDAERREALKFLVHFVGDVHQPLHAGYADDRGGNDYQVNVRGKGSNLHRVWDSQILQSRALEPEAYAMQLRKQPALPRDPTLSSSRPAADWAEESCRLVQQPDFYPGKRALDAAYLQSRRALAEQRLRLAGSRLAAMLNFALR
jgi:hypothetical protein